MYSFNGIGTSLYGKRDIDPDGSYIATKWFVLFFLPIFPIDSYRVWRENTKTTLLLPGAKIEYKIVKVPLNRKQILLTYFFTWGIAITVFILLIYPLI